MMRHAAFAAFCFHDYAEMRHARLPLMPRRQRLCLEYFVCRCLPYFFLRRRLRVSLLSFITMFTILIRH